MATRHLSEIPDGASVFIDANIFIYHFSGPTNLSPACSDFLRRIEAGAIGGLTSTVVLIETLHRLMVLEAAGSFRLPPRDALRYLKEHPQHAKTLLVHQASVQKVRQMNVEVVDALLLAVMDRSGVTTLASNDLDFEMVEAITLYRPTPAG